MNNTPNTSALQAFAFDSHAVRVITKDGQPWFVAKDVAACLQLAHHRDATRKLDDDEKDGVEIVDAIGRPQKTTVVNEAGLYTMILRCDAAMTPGHQAHAFRKWVTSQVLPAIRKTGHYTDPAADAPVSNIDARLDRVIGLLEKLIEVLPALVARPQRRPRRKMVEADAVSILALREQGAQLQDLVATTGFSQTQVWCVITGRYQVMPGGRVIMKPQSKLSQAAMQAMSDTVFGHKPGAAA